MCDRWNHGLTWWDRFRYAWDDAAPWISFGVAVFLCGFVSSCLMQPKAMGPELENPSAPLLGKSTGIPLPDVLGDDLYMKLPPKSLNNR